MVQGMTISRSRPRRRRAEHLGPERRRPQVLDAAREIAAVNGLGAVTIGAIAARLRDAGLDRPDAIAGAGDQALRACGLSGPKIRYLRGIAAAGLDWDALRGLPDAQVSAQLTALPGIGRWTAEMYLLFALGRADVLAPADLALQEAARLMYGLPARPTPKVLEWERIVQEMRLVTERVVRGGEPQDAALADLDKRVDEILAKRRWMYERDHADAAPAHPAEAAR